MNYPAYISPSIACCPLECLEEHVHRLEQLGIEMLHVDIMDGNFVANYCLGTEFIPLLHRILPPDLTSAQRNKSSKIDPKHDTKRRNYPDELYPSAD